MAASFSRRPTGLEGLGFREIQTIARYLDMYSFANLSCVMNHRLRRNLCRCQLASRWDVGQSRELADCAISMTMSRTAQLLLGRVREVAVNSRVALRSLLEAWTVRQEQAETSAAAAASSASGTASADGSAAPLDAIFVKNALIRLPQCLFLEAGVNTFDWSRLARGDGLEHLHLSGAARGILRETIPVRWAPSLCSLSTPGLPAWSGQCTNLRELTVTTGVSAGRQLRPTVMSQLTSLETLSIFGYDVGSVRNAAAVGALARLRCLRLCHCDLRPVHMPGEPEHGFVTTILAGCRQLEELELDMSPFHDRAGKRDGWRLTCDGNLSTWLRLLAARARCAEELATADLGGRGKAEAKAIAAALAEDMGLAPSAIDGAVAVKRLLLVVEQPATAQLGRSIAALGKPLQELSLSVTTDDLRRGRSFLAELQPLSGLRRLRLAGFEARDVSAEALIPLPSLQVLAMCQRPPRRGGAAVQGAECWGAWPVPGSNDGTPSRRGLVWLALQGQADVEHLDAASLAGASIAGSAARASETAAASVDASACASLEADASSPPFRRLMTPFECDVAALANSSELAARMAIFVEQSRFKHRTYVAAPEPPSRQAALPAMATGASGARAACSAAEPEALRLPCPHGCGLMVEKHMVYDHEQLCWTRQRPCPMASFGCAALMCNAEVSGHLDVCPFALVSTLQLRCELPQLGGTPLPEAVPRPQVLRLLASIPSDIEAAMEVNNVRELWRARHLTPRMNHGTKPIQMIGLVELAWRKRTKADSTSTDLTPAAKTSSA